MKTHLKHNRTLGILSAKAVGAWPFLCALLFLLTPENSYTATIPVTNTNDSNNGSLRQAILDSNASVGVLDTITFNIPGAGLHTITPVTVLPTISDPVVIDGYTQPGSKANTLANDDDAVILIELNGASVLTLSSGLSITAGNSVVRGLVINRSRSSGIQILTNGGNAVTGCFIGTDATAATALPNSQGVVILFGPNDTNNTIGGSNPAERNIISGNLGAAGVNIASAFNLVQGNFIGTDRHGTSALGNAVGVSLANSGFTHDNTIGGTNAGAGNVISGNSGFGISAVTLVGTIGLKIQGNLIGTDVTGTARLGNGSYGIYIDGVSDASMAAPIIGGNVAGAGNVISANGNDGIHIASGTNVVVQGNFIGTDLTGTLDLGNNVNGIQIDFSSAAKIGGTGAGEGNTIAFNGVASPTNYQYAGVLVFTGATSNSILGNSIYSNVGLGIDLTNTGTPDGVTPNDLNDSDTGANLRQNYPVITSVTTAGSTTTVNCNLNSAAGAAFHIELFANDAIDPSGSGEGQSLVATEEVTIPAGSNNVSFSFAVVEAAPVSFFTLTATDALGNTSEFSPASGTGAPVITSPLSASVTVGQQFVYQFEATGATTLAVTNLPEGLTFDPSISAIVGIPAVTGTFQVQLSATNESGTTTATLILTLQSAPSSGPVIISSTSATGRTGSPFNFQVITSGGSSATRLSATGLPPGLNADPVTGEISGTATTDGSFLVTLSVTDAGITNTATLQLTFTSDPAVPVIVSPNRAALFPGLPFSYTILAPTSDSTDPVTYSVVGLLPLGLGLDPATGIISGIAQFGFGLQPTPSLAGGVVTNVQIFACNSSGCAAQGLFFFFPTGAANISTRLSVGTDENVLIGGFITQGNAPMKLVVRGIGPSLPLGGVLANPYLELHSGVDTIASNDNWKDDLAGGSQEVAIQNTGLAPTNDLESAILGVLDPGGYTAIVHGTNDGTGVGLVEVYNLGAGSMDVSSEAHLANISTRGLVQTGDNVMIGGFINQGSVPIQVLVRGIGPSLTQFGVTGALANPVLELHKADGTVVTDDDWMTDPTQKTAIMATGLSPTNELESAILVTLPVGEGLYTAIVSGVNGTTGVGLVEAYFGNPCLGTSCP